MTKATQPALVKIEGGTLTPIKVGSTTFPALSFDGKAPAKGATITTVLSGIEYQGIASDVIEAGGNVLIEFEGGLTAI